MFTYIYVCLFVYFALNNILTSNFPFHFFLQLTATTTTMEKNNKLTAEQRGAIIFCRKNGDSYSKIAELLDVVKQQYITH